MVTGDIAEVAGCGNWVRSTAEPEGLHLVRPLWHRPRSQLLGELRRRRFRVVVSYVEAARLPVRWVGRSLDARLVAELLRATRSRGVDASGENGEFHTWVLDGPGFRGSIPLRARPPTAGNAGARWLLPGALERSVRAHPVR